MRRPHRPQISSALSRYRFRVLFRMARSRLRASCSWARPKLGIDDGGHRHRDPLLPRPEGLAAPIARAEILEAGLAARLDPIRRAPAIVPALALVARVRQDPDHGALRPAAPAALAGRHPALDQAPLDRVGTQLLLDQPAVQLAHHRRFALLD